MFGVLPDGVSEVDALREEIVGLQWSYASAKGESGNDFYGYDARTGGEEQFLALALPIGTIVDVRDECGLDTRFVRVLGMLESEGGWLNVRDRGVMRSDEYVCEKARNSPRVVVRRPGEVDAIVDKYEGEPSFVCVNGYTGEECEFRVCELQPGTVIFVEDDSEGDIMFAYVDGVAYEEMWRVTNRYGDVFEVDEPSVDRLAPGASGRLPVVYPVLD